MSVTCLALGALTIMLLGACGQADERPAPGGEETDPLEVAAAAPTVRITEPRSGETLEGSDVTVVLEAEGLAIVPAGTEQASSGHHHLIVNAPLPDLELPIPSEPGRYIHLGQGQTEYVLEDLSPGTHRVIALVGDHVHVSLDPPVADTVEFVVP